MIKMLDSPYILLTLTPLIWSTNFIIGKVLTITFPPFTLTMGRFTIAAFAFALLILANSKKSGPLVISRKLWPYFLAFGFSGIFLFNSLLYMGLRYTTAINATLINAASPIITAVLSLFMLRERITTGQVVGLILSLIGIVWIAVRGSWHVLVNLKLNPGDVIIFLDTIVWAFYSIIGKKLMSYLPPLYTTAVGVFIGVPFLWLASFIEMSHHVPIQLTSNMILAFLYLGIMASVLSYIFWFKGISAIGATKAANFYNLIPVFSAFMAYFFLKERFGLYHFIGGCLVVTGIYLGAGISTQVKDYFRIKTSGGHTPTM